MCCIKFRVPCPQTWVLQYGMLRKSWEYLDHCYSIHGHDCVWPTWVRRHLDYLNLVHCSLKDHATYHPPLCISPLDFLAVVKATRCEQTSVLKADKMPVF